MGKFKYTKPTRVSDLDFDNLFEEISTDLDGRIERFMRRKEREFRRGFAA